MPFLVVLAAALPSLSSLCELHCISSGASANVVSEEGVSSECSGHETDKPGGAPARSPSESSQDCSGHTLLSKSSSIGFQFQLTRAFSGLAVTGVASAAANEVSDHSATLPLSTDLSPPFGRSPGVLRL